MASVPKKPQGNSYQAKSEAIGLDYHSGHSALRAPHLKERPLRTPIPNLKMTEQCHKQRIEQHFLTHHVEIEAWFRKQWQQVSAPIYGSVDIRHAGFKIAPVDMNLFPAGFNNLDPSCLSFMVQALQDSINHYHPNCQRVLLLPENHSRNLFYLESLHVLYNILAVAGYTVEVASLSPTLSQPQTIVLSSGKKICLKPLKRQGDYLSVDNFKPDLILLNNDLSDGCPDILRGLAQPIEPWLQFGWWRRLKSNYFYHYQQLATCFAKVIDLDPWFIIPEFRQCGQVDFLKHKGEACLVNHARQLFYNIKQKYQQFAIDAQPFVVAKADSGTYGMNVMMVCCAEEFKQLNRKKRVKMSASKGRQPVTQVLLQEGIHSCETFDGAVAEPVVYLMGSKVIGGFYRIHHHKGPQENLNAPGMNFHPLPFCDACNVPDDGLSSDAKVNRFYVYGTIARLSMLAAAYEKQELE